MKKPRSRPPSAKSDHAIEFSGFKDEVSLSSLHTRTGLLSRLWRWMQARQMARSSTKRLRVAETVSLGEKRFVAVVQVDGRHFLVAGGPTNIALLAQLNAGVDFEDVLKKTMTVPRKRRVKRKQVAKTAFQRVPNQVAELAQTKSNTTPGRQRKKRASSEVSSSTPPAGPLSGTKPFSAVLKEVMATPKQPRKQKTKQEIRPDTTQKSTWTTEPNGEYA